MRNILGLYSKAGASTKPQIPVGTPDPTKYHDASTVRLHGDNAAPVGSKIPSNSKFTLPGVIIPRSTRDGASMGNDHERPLRVFIDPEQTSNQLVIDLEKIRQNKGQMITAINNARTKGYTDQKDEYIDAYAAFATDPGPDKEQQPREEIREAPIQMPNTYVVPKAAPGGGQVKPAAFAKKAEDIGLDWKTEVARWQEDQAYQTKAQAELQESMTPTPVPVTAVEPVVLKAKSLQQELRSEGSYVTANVTRPMRKVTFELPMPGVKDGSMGQFVCYYSDIVCDDNNMILVNDNSNPSQVTWYPPPLENPETKEPIGIAALIHGIAGERDKLCLVHPTGVQFNYRNETFCILTVDKMKIYDKNNA